MSTADLTQQPTAKRHSRWLWAIAVVGVVVLLGTLLPGDPNVHDMTCVEIRSEQAEIRAHNTVDGQMKYFDDWDRDDLDRMHALVDEVGRRGSTSTFCPVDY